MGASNQRAEHKYTHMVNSNTSCSVLTESSLEVPDAAVLGGGRRRNERGDLGGERELRGEKKKVTLGWFYDFYVLILIPTN